MQDTGGPQQVIEGPRPCPDKLQKHYEVGWLLSAWHCDGVFDGNWWKYVYLRSSNSFFRVRKEDAPKPIIPPVGSPRPLNIANEKQNALKIGQTTVNWMLCGLTSSSVPQHIGQRLQKTIGTQ
jgi:hypothetical protein